VVALNLGELESQPVHDPLSHAVYASSRSQITNVWIAGRAVVKDRELLTLDRAAVIANAEQWRRRMSSDDDA
jgi:5-methylthioadenosine/S-adenosylhomocysteine deaminase